MPVFFPLRGVVGVSQVSPGGDGLVEVSGGLAEAD